MPSLNQIATSILNELGEDTNHELLERIKDRVKFLRSSILRNNIDKYGVDDELVIPLQLKVQPIKLVNCNKVLTNCEILETVNKIPTPVRTTGKPIFRYVGGVSGITPFFYTQFYNIPALLQLPIYAATVFAALVDNKLRIYNNNQFEMIQVDMVVSDINEIINECDKTTGNCPSDNDEFLIPFDIIHSIITTLVSEFMQLNTNRDQAIEITKDV